MCIAICKPQDVIIPTSYLETCFLNNPDGAGFAYTEDNQLIIKKGFMTFDEFNKAFKQHKNKAAIIHFRITTHGDTTPENTHPFQVGKNLAMIHNGVIRAIDRVDDLSKSDTYHFNTKILSQLYKRDTRFIYKPHYKELIKHYIGHSKLVFLNNKGHFEIINEDDGVWEEGVWFSNTTYKNHKFLTPKKVSHTPFKNTNTNKLESNPANVFAQGSRVSVNLHNKRGEGTIMHFTGGLMVGVLLDGEEKTSLFPIAALNLIAERTENNNPFEVGDWVTRTDSSHNKIYEVVGTAKDTVWIQGLNDFYTTEGSTYTVNYHKLTYYMESLQDFEYNSGEHQ